MEYVLARVRDGSGHAHAMADHRYVTAPKTAAQWTRSTAACSAPTPPTPTGCAGTGSTARNPNCPPDGPQIWLAREGPTVVGQYATMPVRLSVPGRGDRRRPGAWTSWWRPSASARASARCCSARGTRTSARRSAWASPSRRTGCSRSCGGRTSGPVPCLVKPLTRRALRRPNWPMPVNRFVSAVTLPLRPRRRAGAAAQARGRARFAASTSEFTALWERLAPKFDLRRAPRRAVPELEVRRSRRTCATPSSR